MNDLCSTCGACGSVANGEIARARSFIDGSQVLYVACSACGTLVSMPCDRTALYVDRGSGNYDQSPRFFRWLKQHFIANGVRRYKSERNQQVLDFGCGAGDLANALVASGWSRVDATDVQEVAPDNLKPTIKYFPLRDLGGCKGQYDLVFARHVVEHVEDLSSTLTLLALTLSPGGRMVCEVPNVRSPFRKMMGSRWPGYYAPFHVHVFSAKGLEKAFLNVGLEVAAVRRANSPVVGSFLIQFGWPRLACKAISILFYPFQLAWSRLAGQAESFVIEAVRPPQG